jgi:hypothetical protein
MRKLLLALLAPLALVLAGCASYSSAHAPRPNTAGHYPTHSGIVATVFWVGEASDSDNHFIPNNSSAWVGDWQGEFGGIDDPARRCRVYLPCFTYNENPFYFALPFNDYNQAGNLKSSLQLSRIYWHNGPPAPGASLVKNRWIRVTNGNKVAYAQWEDVGPVNEDDSDYVFGNAMPRYRAGLDLSPATAVAVGLDGEGPVSWTFVPPDQVPDGPWRAKTSTTGIRQ